MHSLSLPSQRLTPPLGPKLHPLLLDCAYTAFSHSSQIRHGRHKIFPDADCTARVAFHFRRPAYQRCLDSAPRSMDRLVQHGIVYFLGTGRRYIADAVTFREEANGIVCRKLCFHRRATRLSRFKLCACCSTHAHHLSSRANAIVALQALSPARIRWRPVSSQLPGRW